MKKLIAYLLIAALLLGCTAALAAPSDEELVGTWKASAFKVNNKTCAYEDDNGLMLIFCAPDEQGVRYGEMRYGEISVEWLTWSVSGNTVKFGSTSLTWRDGGLQLEANGTIIYFQKAE